VNRIISNIEEHQIMIGQMLAEGGKVLESISDAIVKSLRGGGKVLLAGNGGSAADAQHIAGEFIGRFLYDRRALPAVALSTDSSVLTCVGNDYSYNDVFLRLVNALGKPGDVLWVFSTSGNSPNILSAVEAARSMGMVVIGFTGQDGGKLKDICNLCFRSPHRRTNRIQEAHMLAYHIVCEMMEAALCPQNGS